MTISDERTADDARFGRDDTGGGVVLDVRR